MAWIAKPEELKQRTIKYYQDNFMSIEQFAEATGMSVATAQRWLKLETTHNLRMITAFRLDKFLRENGY